MLHQELQCAIELNNHGAHALHDCNYDDAIKHLSNALKASKHYIRACEIDGTFAAHHNATNKADILRPGQVIRLDQMVTTRDTTAQHAGTPSWASAPTVPAQAANPACTITPAPTTNNDGGTTAAATNSSSANDHDDDDDTVNGHYIYTTPMFITPRAPADAAGMYEISLATSAVIVFNLAISHHLYSTHAASPTKASSKLRKAIRLYDLALMLYEDRSLDGSSLLVAAIVNNLGVANLKLQLQDAAMRCFRSLLASIVMLEQQDDGCTAEASQFRLFLRNAIQWIGCRSTGAAAAAA